MFINRKQKIKNKTGKIKFKKLVKWNECKRYALCVVEDPFNKYLLCKHLYTDSGTILGFRYKMVNKTNAFPTQNMFLAKAI